MSSTGSTPSETPSNRDALDFPLVFGEPVCFSRRERLLVVVQSLLLRFQARVRGDDARDDAPRAFDLGHAFGRAVEAQFGYFVFVNRVKVKVRPIKVNSSIDWPSRRVRRRPGADRQAFQQRRRAAFVARNRLRLVTNTVSLFRVTVLGDVLDVYWTMYGQQGGVIGLNREG